jgi:hypothetical protein
MKRFFLIVKSWDPLHYRKVIVQDDPEVMNVSFLPLMFVNDRQRGRQALISE